ncbi:MAG TPA: hypothetical protein VMV49_03590 [Candidatus Deferrimicrobium sp.]|nr:hypothetical protein [Candidatus Deferrimicrobium sp.]
MPIKLKELVLENEKGGKMTISFDGSFSSEDILKLVEKIQDESPTPKEPGQIGSHSKVRPNYEYDSLTIRAKLEEVVNQINYGWFSSDQIRELYQLQFHEDIKPSTVSTYLARMFEDNFLERRGSRARREYRIAGKQIIPIEYIKEV